VSPFGGTSVKQTNLVKETGDLNNSQKVNAVAVIKDFSALDICKIILYNIYTIL
jgi:hypothetical protein